MPKNTTVNARVLLELKNAVAGEIIRAANSAGNKIQSIEEINALYTFAKFGILAKIDFNSLLNNIYAVISKFDQQQRLEIINAVLEQYDNAAPFKYFTILALQKYLGNAKNVPDVLKRNTAWLTPQPKQDSQARQQRVRIILSIVESAPQAVAVAKNTSKRKPGDELADAMARVAATRQSVMEQKSSRVRGLASALQASPPIGVTIDIEERQKLTRLDKEAKDILVKTVQELNEVAQATYDDGYLKLPSAIRNKEFSNELKTLLTIISQTQSAAKSQLDPDRVMMYFNEITVIATKIEAELEKHPKKLVIDSASSSKDKPNQSSFSEKFVSLANKLLSSLQKLFECIKALAASMLKCLGVKGAKKESMVFSGKRADQSSASEPRSMADIQQTIDSIRPI